MDRENQDMKGQVHLCHSHTSPLPFFQHVSTQQSQTTKAQNHNLTSRKEKKGWGGDKEKHTFSKGGKQVVVVSTVNER